MIEYSITKENVHIRNSCDVPKGRFDRELWHLRILYPSCQVFRRSQWSLRMEWATHNALYRLGIQRSRTKDVDLNYPQKWWVRAAYSVAGPIVWLFIP